ncbi:MAG: 4-hydroxythreonine-4-phosphate dehydrogenase PdxA [Endozoicomonas sp. (ex Botrylloides leachii)]|nr:4-hydroxythreonine-4-phosphate dehydrogenase PdxA [Endozoicomonas sp. (ex Botrylloides leachii)]
MRCPRLAITAGEPAGIGPDLCLMLAQQQHHAQQIVIADPELLAYRAAELGIKVTLTLFDKNDYTPARVGELLVSPISMLAPCSAGQLNPENSAYVLQILKTATKGCLSGQFDAMVTAPIHKGAINEGGFPFTGHTEYLAELTNTDRVVMMLATEGLRVGLATTHLPLSDVPKAITPTCLTEVLNILHWSLHNHFHIDNPCILVCGLNPHAGEGGHLGMEEIEVITPVIDTLKKQGLNLIGPLPADTLFTPDKLAHCDAVLAMYHDQGLPVLKYKGFGNAANITLGLPIIRTSVDHGTALELAGTGKASIGSMITAIDMAISMIN